MSSCEREDVSALREREQTERTYFLVRRERRGIHSIALLRELERRNDERRKPALEPRHDFLRTEDARSEVGADPEVDVEHHHVLRTKQ